MTMENGGYVGRRLVNLRRQTLIQRVIGILYWAAGGGGKQADENFIPCPSILSFAIA